MQTFIDKKA